MVGLFDDEPAAAPRRKFVAFDIETAKLLPDAAGDLLAHRPLGIACAAAFSLDIGREWTWHGKMPLGIPSEKMSVGEAAALIGDLESLVAEGYTIVTWNGLSFDFNVLAEESKLPERCAALALSHVDMMFQVLCSQGHFLSLAKAAAGMELPGKLAGITGAQAPQMWAAGRYDEVLAYNLQDVRVTADLAAAGERARELRWKTKNEKTATMPLPTGWLTVREAMALPEPDTSWMSTKPPSRATPLSWIPAELRP